jgi:hypothetical protein
MFAVAAADGEERRRRVGYVAKGEEAGRRARSASNGEEARRPAGSTNGGRGPSAADLALPPRRRRRGFGAKIHSRALSTSSVRASAVDPPSRRRPRTTRL